MKLRLCSFGFLAMAASLGMTACGGSDVGPLFDGSNGTDGTTGADSGGGMDATMMMDTSANDADMDGTSSMDAQKDTGGGNCGLMPDAGTCNTLVATGQSIKPNCHGGGPPTAVGGKIADGHYVLTGIDYYNFNTTCPTELEKIDWVICGNQWETVQVSGNNTSHDNITANVMSPKLALSVTCPNMQTVNWTYDVTMSGLVFYLPAQNGSTRASTYTKM
jgi:hypothetical protein